MSRLGVVLTWAADSVYLGATVAYRVGDALNTLASLVLDQ